MKKEGILALLILALLITGATGTGPSQQKMELEYQQAVNEWKSKRKMSSSMAKTINMHFDQFIEGELEQIEKSIADNKPQFAFISMLDLITIINECVKKLPDMFPKLETSFIKLKSVGKSLGEKLGAEEFSISVGSGGISFGLSFPIS